MRARRATLAVATTIALLTGATAAHATPTDVQVRIEGVTSTRFDRVVRTDGHDVRAASDRQARRCDGTNNGANPGPGPTATAATADALATLGQAFDGQWHAGLDDYFIRQLGPEREDNDKLWWWGLVVDRAFSPRGGCQVRVGAGEEVLWADDAFSGRPFLWLAGAVAMPTALVDTPLPVTVTSTDASAAAGDGDPYAGAQVAAVTADGQPAAAGVATGRASAADGTATVAFHVAGWQRLKARDPGPGTHPLAIASNSVDVCVEATPGAGCTGAPPSRQPVVPPGGGDTPPGGGDTPPGGNGAPPGGGAPPATGPRAPAPPATARPAWLRRFVDGTLRDDRARVLDREGAWQRIAVAGAWQGTLSRGGPDARVRLRLGAGRAAFLLRLGAGAGQIELRAGGEQARVTLPAGSGVRIVRAPRLRRSGAVELRVLRGMVRLDGVGRAA